ncbi:hypothetical protein A4A49_13344 [Nicotiana attenuata]|uniref:Uncharacterized protein n=1 Tax=Nicotiana attenuata TaxID=49451 RepID=A0A314KQ16_NICAT|nr:hypothetical protein A4A49_13344 [Nicotiana attenuata]
MSMDTHTLMDDHGDSFQSNTDAIIYVASDISGWTQSLISDPNIPNSSNSTSVANDHQQQISTAAGGGTDLILSGASSRFKNNKLIEQEYLIRGKDQDCVQTSVFFRELGRMLLQPFNLSTQRKRREEKKRNFREMSMDTIMEDDGDSFVSYTDAIIYTASDITGWTQSLISDPNIPNSSNSTSVDDHQQQISTAAGGGTDDLIVASSASSRIYNVDFRAFSRINDVCNNCNEDNDEVEVKASEINNRLKSCAGSELGLGLNIDMAVNNETNINIFNNNNVVESSKVNDC